MSSKVIELPIQPHIKKFLIHELGESPITCNQSNIAGRQLLNLIVKKSNVVKEESGLDTIKLKLSSDLYIHKSRLLKQAVSGKAYEDYFKIALRNFVHGCAPFLGSRKKAISIFMEKYNISPFELNIDSVERSFHDRKNCNYTVPRKVYQSDLYDSLVENNNKLRTVVSQMSRCLDTISNF
ncbi:hypothetical protein [Chondrinema litorale]|uniref:hypothetical protein n=1 Tax=Chondrinema litorale TaxID=2994555 RepID=UPI0025426BC3|nr:hypothetical protein [Chondrinema litorale]UZR93159.1 hypothetical protein OQ292_14965 [Chondrinema litorale]